MIEFSVGTNTFDNRPVNESAESFDAFRDRVLSLRSPRKGMSYITGPFNGDGTRKKEGVLPRAWLPLDFDYIECPETFQDLCLYLGRYEYFGYTTASHTEDKPRARAIIGASRAMTRAECQRIGATVQSAISAKFGERVKLDGTVYRSEQPVYTPLTGAKVWRSDGEPLDVDALLEIAPEIKEDYRADERAALEAASDPVLAVLAARKMIKKDMGNGRYAVHCPCASEHTSQSSETATVYMLPNFGGVRYGKFHCLHSHCEHRDQSEFLRALDLDPKKVWSHQLGKDEPKKDAQPEGKRSGLKKLVGIDARELIQKEFAPIQWAVPGLLPEGATLFVGAPKVGKSWAALDWAVAIASGGYVFGSIQCDPGEVMYLALEDNQRRMKRRLQKALRGAPMPAGLTIFTEAPRLDQGLIQELEEHAAARPQLRLIIIDTLKTVRPPAKQHDKVYDSDYDVGRPFLELASRLGVSVVLVHHTNKSKSDDDLEIISGSTGLAGGMDNILVLKRGRGEAEATLYVTGRDIEQEARHPLRWDSQNATWLLMDDCPTHGMSPARRAVYDGVLEHQPINGKDLTSVLYPGLVVTRESKEWMRTRKILNELRKAGLIEMCTEGKFTGTHTVHGHSDGWDE